MLIEGAVLHVSFIISYSLKDGQELDPAVVFIVDPFRLHDCMDLLYGAAIRGVKLRVIDVRLQLDRCKY